MEKTQKTNLTNDSVEPQADTLNDLPVAGKQAEEAKGGAGSSGSIMAQLGDGSVRTVR
jgi:hypothetical protein